MRYILAFLILTCTASAQIDSTSRHRAIMGRDYPRYGHTAILDTITFDVPMWEDLREQPILINPVGAVASPTRDAATGKLLFNGTTDNAIALYFQTSHMMKRNYDSLYLHVHWRKTTDVAGTVDWTATYTIINIDTVASEASGEIAMHEENSLGSTQKHMISEIGILNSNIDNSAIIYITITRDASADGYNADVELMYVDIHMPVNKLGSRSPIPVGDD